MLNIVLEVVDGTEAVPKGSIVYHSIVLLPGSGASEERIAQVMRFMKPTVMALTGLSKIEISQDFIHENLEIDYDVDPFIVKKDHKMKENVMVTIEEEYNETMRKQDYKVKSIAAARPGDKSVSKTETPEDNVTLDQEADSVKTEDADLTVDENTDSADETLDSSEVEDY